MKDAGRCILFFILVAVFTLVLVSWTSAIEDRASENDPVAIETLMPSVDNASYLNVGN